MPRINSLVSRNGGTYQLTGKPVTFRAVKHDWTNLVDGPVLDYLQGRGISYKTLVTCHVQEKDNEWYVFLCQTLKNQTCMAEYVSIHRVDGKKKSYITKDTPFLLWGMNFQLTENILPDSWIIITEGKMDAMSYIQQGLRAVSIPTGAENDKWIENCWKWLDQFTCIYLSYDMDEAGQTAVHKVAARLGLERCKLVVIAAQGCE